MIYHIYLTEQSTVEASTADDRSGIYLGSIDMDDDDLPALINFCQNTADAVILQLAEKTDQMFHNKNPKDLN